MADNENHPPEQEKPDKKLRLDLSEAMPHGFDEDDDEIIELKDEVNITPEKAETENEYFEESDEPDTESELPAVENIIDLDALEDEDSELENVIRMSEDLAFDEENEDTKDLPPVGKEPLLKADDHDEVDEISEFDDILSEDTNEMVTLSEISEVLDIEEEDEDDEFLELIDVEENDETELQAVEEDVIKFDEPGADIEDVELKDLIDDSLNEEVQINESFEDDLVSTLSDEAGKDLDLAQQTPAEEEFDFSMDSSEISKKIDQLDTIFFDDTEAEAELDENDELDEEANETQEPLFEDIEDEIDEEESEPIEPLFEDIEDEIDEEESEPLESLFEDIEDEIDEVETERVTVSGDESTDVPHAVGGTTASGVSQDQIEETIEQIIERKYSGKIESLVTQIIEKAVKKEIQRLKQILLEEDEHDEKP